MSNPQESSNLYQAVGHNGLNITTVIATSVTEARDQIAVELRRNRSRYAYYESWVAGGSVVTWPDANGVKQSDKLGE